MQPPLSSNAPDASGFAANDLAANDLAANDRAMGTTSPEVATLGTASPDREASGAAALDETRGEAAFFVRATPPSVEFEPVRIAPPPNAASLAPAPLPLPSAMPPVMPSQVPASATTAPNQMMSNQAMPSQADATNLPPIGMPPVVAQRPNTLGFLHTLLLGGLLACALVGLGAALGRRGASESSTGTAATGGTATADLANQNAIVSAVQAIGPAVMNVDTTFGGGGSKEFLPDPSTAGRPVQGKGTGFVIDSKRGLMLTNAHVVADAQKIQVTTRDGKKYTGKILGVDRQSDIAVVKLSSNALPEAKLAPLKNARDVQIGQWAIAIGNPFAQANTVTVGVVSAVGRTIPVPDEKHGGTFQLIDMIQTDAAINPGNSGGPLCNIKGEVIGINTAIYGIGTGLGFSIPINKAYAVAEQIIAHGSVQRAFVGLQLQAISPATKQEYGLKDTQGALVQNAVAGSPAAKAGFQAGDIIRRINGETIKDMPQAQATIQKQKVGATLKIEILRNSTVQKTLTLKTIAQPDA